MKKFFSEFKEFALKGNVMSLAVGVIIGAAFQGVVTSLTDNIISPIVGLFVNQNFDSLELSILGVSLRYGAFLTAVLNFLIMALVVFVMVRAVNRLMALGEKPRENQPAAPPRLCPYCKTAVNEEATRCPACTSAI